MKRRKINLIGDSLSTATGAFLSFVIFTYFGTATLWAFTTAVIASLIVFAIARKCDFTKDDTIAEENDYPPSLFASMVFACLAATLVISCFGFVLLTYTQSFLHLIA
ncbi:MAG: hypothetical protein NTZ13_04230 [Candidatus Parcubacteria bacterium]|nr:hypothetical protein [Candidatus Parcubacteria bacterium]